ncbi:MAG UNVERIFIED_CONTAM: hypothetical protein LVR18_17320 [Planctomycetaceae bacterium]
MSLCELLSEIELTRRSGDRSLAEAEAAFQALNVELSPLLRGVWQERRQYCERRLELVLLAGAVGADAIEAVLGAADCERHRGCDVASGADHASARCQQGTQGACNDADW